MLCWRARPTIPSGRRCGLRWSKWWGGRLSALRELSRPSSNLRHCWGTPSGATVLKLWMVPSSSTWLRRCGGSGQRCRRLLLRRVVRTATWPMWRARRATSAAVRPLCYCAIAATGGTTRAAWSQHCLVCLTVIGYAPAVLLRRPRRPPSRLPLPLPAAGPGPRPRVMWLARCVLASTVRPQCCCAMAATGGSTCGALACASSACPLGTGTAQLVLGPLLTILSPLLATLAAARGPMVLALRSVYENNNNIFITSRVVRSRVLGCAIPRR
jgi:hypothetical protein